MTKTLRNAALAAALALTAACSGAADAPPLAEGDWTLDPAGSKLSYVTVKLGEVAEANSFQTLSGTVGASGAANITIDLASVETGVDIRNERMRDVLFVVADNPTANITAELNPALFNDLAVGATTGTTFEGTVTLKGAEVPFETSVSVTRLGPDRVLAVSDKPVIVTAEQFGLTEGLAELQSLANLASITPAVPVTFSLVFER